MTIALLNTAGLVLSLIGVIILFLYGMPFHVPTRGTTFLVAGQKSQPDIRKEKAYQKLGYLGLIFIVVGTAF